MSIKSKTFTWAAGGVAAVAIVGGGVAVAAGAANAAAPADHSTTVTVVKGALPDDVKISGTPVKIGTVSPRDIPDGGTLTAATPGATSVTEAGGVDPSRVPTTISTPTAIGKVSPGSVPGGAEGRTTAAR